MHLTFCRPRPLFFGHVAAIFHTAAEVAFTAGMRHDAVLIYFLRGLVFGLGEATDEQHRSECFDEYAFHSRLSRSGLY